MILTRKTDQLFSVIGINSPLLALLVYCLFLQMSAIAQVKRQLDHDWSKRGKNVTTQAVAI